MKAILIFIVIISTTVFFVGKTCAQCEIGQQWATADSDPQIDFDKQGTACQNAVERVTEKVQNKCGEAQTCSLVECQFTPDNCLAAVSPPPAPYSAFFKLECNCQPKCATMERVEAQSAYKATYKEALEDLRTKFLLAANCPSPCIYADCNKIVKTVVQKQVLLEGKCKCSYKNPDRMGEQDNDNIDATGMGIAHIYPNPSNGFLHLEYVSRNYNTAQLIVYDFLGKIMFSENDEVVPGANSLDISLFMIPPGIYFLSIKNGNDVNSIKFSIEK